MAKKPDSRLKRAGVSGYNKPKRTPNHPTKSHVVVAKKGDQIKTIRYGQQGVKGGLLRHVMVKTLLRVLCLLLIGLIKVSGN